MVTRFYLIPFETDAAKLKGMEAAPKYLDRMPVGRQTGLIPKETTIDKLNKTWLRDYYVVKIVTEDALDFAALDAQSDVIHITKQKILDNIGKVQALGIDTTGLSESTTLSQMQKRIRQWLTEETGKDFSEI